MWCSPRLPLLHVYFHHELPHFGWRSPRYVAYQLEYSLGKVTSTACAKFMSEAVVAWDYTAGQTEFWHSQRGMRNVTHVSVTAATRTVGLLEQRRPRHCRVCMCMRQMPLCFHPVIEYKLPPASEPQSETVVFPGLVGGKRRRENIIAELRGAGITVDVRQSRPMHDSICRGTMLSIALVFTLVFTLVTDVDVADARNAVLCSQTRSYLARDGPVRALYGVHDVMDARRNAMVLNIHAYDDSGLSQLEVRQCCYVSTSCQ